MQVRYQELLYLGPEGGRVLVIEGVGLGEQFEVGLLALNAADRHLCVLAVVVCHFLADEAESVLALLRLAALHRLLDLVDHLSHHQRHIVLDLPVLTLEVDEFGHFLGVEFGVDPCLELGDVLLDHGECAYEPGVPEGFEFAQEILR